MTPGVLPLARKLGDEGPLDVCRCGCSREDHPNGGPCSGFFACRPGCDGFQLVHTENEMATMFDKSVRHMERERRTRAQFGIDEEGTWKP